ncbi:MAG: DUF421 domain-containing protein [Sphingomonadales bacterium]|nr:DUF421 domain-containing protein [Sphingomonadales bacterium]NCQ22534.1 DUF421 domain-containing protein [Sphingomonadales bacterium]NCT05078.1 DUF421 domain-containing protein [Sphingomonadales bacterium]
MFDLPLEWDILARGIVLTVAGLVWILLLVRIIGLRSFSKMTAFDFVITLATGSLLASAATVTRWPAFFQITVALVVLMGVQAGLALLRKSNKTVRKLMGNTPLLLMRDGEFLDEAMRSSRVAREDVLAKLRGANVTELTDVRAVVLESTGNISVLHGKRIDPEMLEGVRGA